MTQVNIRGHEAATYWGSEGTYGSVAAQMKRVLAIGDVTMDPQQTEIEIMDESVFVNDYKGTIHGLKKATSKFGTYLRTCASQITGTAPTTPDSALAIKTMFGGEALSDGTTVASAASATQFTVAAGKGAGFPVGTLCAVQNSAGTMDVARVITQATDTITVYPPLSGTPSAGYIVANSATYYCTDANTASMSIQHAKAADANWQWQMLASIGDVEFGTDRDALVTQTWSWRHYDWSFGALGIGTSYATSADSAPFALTNATTLLQPTATTTRVQYRMTAFKAAFDLGMDTNPQLGGVNGTSGVMRVKGRPQCKITMTIDADSALSTSWWTNQTLLNCMIFIPQGSGTATRFLAFDAPQALIVGFPKTVYQNGRVYQTVELNCKANPTASTDLARKPASWSLL